MSKKKKDLKFGFTTGTAAAAAAKGALSLLLEDKAPLKVKIELLTGRAIDIPLQTCEKQDTRTATCTVIKDAGDDPDVTHKAVIGAR
ncbi:MAG: cobalt-precorrin-5B (C(1))-methyltransferase, partial [Deltaproteobacteria bacterium]|nr:cobalt-precorrin-5B (C(1))-methyltransferase [Deltaproteobacteria bacterium]